MRSWPCTSLVFIPIPLRVFSPPSQGGEKEAPASSSGRNKTRSGPGLMAPRSSPTFHHCQESLPLPVLPRKWDMVRVHTNHIPFQETRAQQTLPRSAKKTKQLRMNHH